MERDSDLQSNITQSFGESFKKSGKIVGATRGHRTDKPGLIPDHREWTNN